MPISREEFERDQIDLTPDIRAVLEANPERALTAEEVREVLAQGFGREATLEEVEEALDRSVEQRRVERRDLSALHNSPASFETCDLGPFNQDNPPCLMSK